MLIRDRWVLALAAILALTSTGPSRAGALPLRNGSIHFLHSVHFPPNPCLKSHCTKSPRQGLPRI
jgi:hypothetical protein